MIARALAVGAAASLLAGCSYLGIGSDAPKPTPLTPINATVTPKIAWSASIGKSGPYRIVPAARDGKVYTANGDGAILILEEESGRVVLRFDSKKKIAGGVAVDENAIIVGTMKGDVTAFDAAGKERWNLNVAGEVIAPAGISKKIAVVRTSDGRIFGVSTADGKRLWVYQRPSPALLLRTAAGVYASGSDIVAGYPGGKLITLDLDDGKLIWEVSVSPPRGATELERISDVAGVPVIDGGRVCAAAFQGKVACFEIQSRNMVWSRDISSSRAVALDGKNAYVVDDIMAVHALDKGSGSSVWKQDKLAYRKLTDPVLVNGNVVVGDGLGYVHVLAAADGAFIGRLQVDSTAIQAMVPTVKGVLVQTAGGTLALVSF